MNSNLFASYIPFLLNSFLKWSKEHNKKPIIEVLVKNLNIKALQGHPEVVCFDISASSVSNLKIKKNLLSFVANISGEKINLSIPYENILRAFTYEEGFGIDLGEILSQIVCTEPENLLSVSGAKKTTNISTHLRIVK